MLRPIPLSKSEPPLGFVWAKIAPDDPRRTDLYCIFDIGEGRLWYALIGQNRH
jgi:hypothetical protein